MKPSSHRNLFVTTAAIAAASMLAACASAPPQPPPDVSTAKGAIANLAPASGSLVSGRVMLVPTADGVRLTGEIGGLGRGAMHGIHVHERGDCSAADASSAGPHFNPAASAHGRNAAPVHHGGDIDNLVANADGVARIDFNLRGVTLGGGAASDIAGRGLLVHAMPDDYSTQPGGNSGARVACGVIRVTQ